MLNQYQANTLTVALRSLERLLFSLESLCDAGDPGDAVNQGILLNQANPLTPEQRASLKQLTLQAPTQRSRSLST
jgi:hypothetical protein